MTKEELIAELERIAKGNDDWWTGEDHMQADDALLNYINDPDIRAAYEAKGISKFYV